MSLYKLEQHPEYGFLQVKPTPSPEEIAQFYAQEFYSNEYPRLNNSSLEVQLEDKKFYDLHREDICESIQTILDSPLKGLKVLDVGCGWGQTLLHFQSKGMDCYGFDPADGAIEYGKKQGLKNVVKAGLDTMNVFNQQFDVVTLFNVLEHLAEPAKVIEEIRTDVLKSGGLIIVDVPNEFNSLQVAGKELHELSEWWVTPPAHLNYFNKDTLCNLLAGKGYKTKLAESSFPLEMFLLFGRNYVQDRALGKQCHNERVNFERNLRKYAGSAVLRGLYQSLANINIGRQVLVFAVSEVNK
jgi:2-polyprenyl-3-methyl-5-hydroxy-6-metoxy-1,4-benzoquinol methylase